MSKRGIEAGRAYVTIGATTKELEKGLKKANRMVATFSKTMTKLGAAGVGIVRVSWLCRFLGNGCIRNWGWGHFTWFDSCC